MPTSSLTNLVATRIRMSTWWGSNRESTSEGSVQALLSYIGSAPSGELEAVPADLARSHLHVLLSLLKNCICGEGSGGEWSTWEIVETINILWHFCNDCRSDVAISDTERTLGDDVGRTIGALLLSLVVSSPVFHSYNMPVADGTLQAWSSRPGFYLSNLTGCHHHYHHHHHVCIIKSLRAKCERMEMAICLYHGWL